MTQEGSKIKAVSQPFLLSLDKNETIRQIGNNQLKLWTKNWKISEDYCILNYQVSQTLIPRNKKTGTDIPNSHHTPSH